jgi:hypothetical protein
MAGEAWSGKFWCGEEWLGEFRQARLGSSRFGVPWLGAASQGRRVMACRVAEGSGEPWFGASLHDSAGGASASLTAALMEAGVMRMATLGEVLGPALEGVG